MGESEIALARDDAIPALVQATDLRGDLHVHTDWSDGRDPIEMVVAAAQERGYEYVAITDHSQGLGVANGLSVERLAAHNARLAELERDAGGMAVLRGTEMDIRADGSMDYPDSALSQLDWVVASVHSAMNQPPQVR